FGLASLLDALAMIVAILAIGFTPSFFSKEDEKIKS
ncbi:MAG: hypothetical protein RIQ88_756, partial [Actinomycetota bacterium]